MEDLFDIARYILKKNPNYTDKQIQKLTYYAYCWYIVKNNTDSKNITNRLVKQHPEAWRHGPVFYDLFEEMTYNKEEFKKKKENLNDTTKKLLDKIVIIYGKYTGNQLEDMTHHEEPWKEARGYLKEHERSRNPLSDKVIFEYYSS